MKDLLINQADYSKINPTFNETLKLLLAQDIKIDSYMKNKGARMLDEKNYELGDKEFQLLVKEIFKGGKE